MLDRLPFNARLIDRVVGNNVAGCDKKGRPIYIEKSGSVHVDAFLACFTDDDILMAHIWQQENSVRRAAESSKQRGEHVELFTQILDLNGLSMQTQRATKFTKMIVANDNAFYPERLGDLFVINAPWVRGQARTYARTSASGDRIAASGLDCTRDGTHPPLVPGDLEARSARCTEGVVRSGPRTGERKDVAVARLHATAAHLESIDAALTVRAVVRCAAPPFFSPPCARCSPFCGTS